MGIEEMQEKKECVVGIDIGSSNVAVAIGYKGSDGVLEVKGVEIQSVGNSVEDGIITNVVELGSAITTAKSALERDLNVTIKEAFVGISGSEVYGARYEDFVYISSPNNLITESDVHDLTERINKVSTNSDDVIVERVLQRYIVDDRQEVKDPVGAFGSKLSAEYLLVLCNKKQIERIKQTLFQAGLQYRGVCINPMVQSLSLLSNEEKEEGVAIVDIGCDLTDISVVRQGKVCFFASLPIGASSINNDLGQFVSASKSNIEKLKKSYGEAIAENVELTATCSVEVLGHSRKQILKRNVVEIIEERLKDIARFALKSLRDAKLSNKIPCGVILTGGSTYLTNIAQLFSREMNLNVRCAETLYGIDEESKSKVIAKKQSVVVGILLHSAQKAACAVAEKVVIKPVQQPTPPVPPIPPTPAPTPTPTPTPPAPPKPEPMPEPKPEPPITNEGETAKPINDAEKDVEQGKDEQSGKANDNGGKKRENKGGWIKKLGNIIDGLIGNESDDNGYL